MQTQVINIVSRLQNDVQMQTLLEGTSTTKGIYPERSGQLERFPCITYAVISPRSRAVPHFAQDFTMIFNIYSRTNKAHVENIYSRLYALLNLYSETGSGPRNVWAIESGGMDDNDTDRQIYKKIARFQIIGKNE